MIDLYRNLTSWYLSDLNFIITIIMSFPLLTFIIMYIHYLIEEDPDELIVRLNELFTWKHSDEE